MSAKQTFWLHTSDDIWHFKYIHIKFITAHIFPQTFSVAAAVQLKFGSCHWKSSYFFPSVTEHLKREAEGWVCWKFPTTLIKSSNISFMKEPQANIVSTDNLVVNSHQRLPSCVSSNLSHFLLHHCPAGRGKKKGKVRGISPAIHVHFGKCSSFCLV